MNLIGKVFQMFGFHQPPSANVSMALDMARSISRQADAVNQTLQPYMSAPDPFEAFIADTYTARKLEEAAVKGSGTEARSGKP